jgi:hypothetical protein
MEWSTLAAEPIPHKKLLSRLAQSCLDELMVRALRPEPGFDELQFRAHHKCFVQNFSELEAKRTLSVNQFSNAFGCSASCVKRALANGQEAPKVRGRHSAIDDGSEADILQWIEAQAQKYNPVMRTGRRHHYQAQYPVLISRGWSIRSFYATETNWPKPKVRPKKTLY